MSHNKQVKQISSIKIDSREQRSGIPEILKNSGMNIEIINNQSTDYIINNNCGLERKTINDFLSSIGDTRFFKQVRDIKYNFPSSLVILEGGGLFIQKRQIHPNCIRGVIIWTSIIMRVPIIRTMNSEDTAKYLYSISKRLCVTKSTMKQSHIKANSFTNKKSPLNSIPGIGPLTSKNLQKHFKSINQIANCPIEDLCKIQGIGKSKANTIKRILN